MLNISPVVAEIPGLSVDEVIELCWVTVEERNDVSISKNAPL